MDGLEDATVDDGTPQSPLPSTRTERYTEGTLPGALGVNWSAKLRPSIAPSAGSVYDVLMTPCAFRYRITNDPGDAAPGGGLGRTEGEAGGGGDGGGRGGEYGGLGCAGGAMAMHVESIRAATAPIESM